MNLVSQRESLSLPNFWISGQDFTTAQIFSDEAWCWVMKPVRLKDNSWDITKLDNPHTHKVSKSVLRPWQWLCIIWCYHYSMSGQCLACYYCKSSCSHMLSDFSWTPWDGKWSDTCITTNLLLTQQGSATAFKTQMGTCYVCMALRVESIKFTCAFQHVNHLPTKEVNKRRREGGVIIPSVGLQVQLCLTWLTQMGNAV